MLHKAVAYLNSITEVIAGCMLVVMVVVIFAQVFARFILDTGFGWGEELARFLFIWCVFLGASIGVYHKAHLGIEAVTKHFSPSNRVKAAICSHLLCIVLFCHLIFYGEKTVSIVFRQASPGLDMSMGWPYAAIPISGGIMLLHTVALMAQLLTDKEGGQP